MPTSWAEERSVMMKVAAVPGAGMRVAGRAKDSEPLWTWALPRTRGPSWLGVRLRLCAPDGRVKAKMRDKSMKTTAKVRRADGGVEHAFNGVASFKLVALAIRW